MNCTGGMSPNASWAGIRCNQPATALVSDGLNLSKIGKRMRIKHLSPVSSIKAFWFSCMKSSARQQFGALVSPSGCQGRSGNLTGAHNRQSGLHQLLDYFAPDRRRQNFRFRTSLIAAFSSARSAYMRWAWHSQHPAHVIAVARIPVRLVLALPLIVCDVANTMLTTQLSHRHTSLAFFQYCNDLTFCTSPSLHGNLRDLEVPKFYGSLSTYRGSLRVQQMMTGILHLA